MPWTTRFLWISFLLCGASWLFPPALLITTPIFAVAIVVWFIAAIVGVFRGQQAAQPAAPPPPNLPDMSLDELWRLNNPPRDEGDGR